MKMITAGTRVTEEDMDKLKWLAYDRKTSVSALIAAYIEKGMAEEDLSRFVPPQEE